MTFTVDEDLAGLFVEYYNRMKEEGKNYIPDTRVAKDVLVKIYDQYVDACKITPIEYLSLEEKQALVAECKKMGVLYE